MRFLIHACPQRMWYVKEYLIPSMQEQGIKDISVDCDTEHRGNLESFMQSFLHLEDDGGMWHLNDDILICRKFAEMTEKYDDGIVCGFACWPTTPSGIGKAKDLWWSFPCIRIPNEIARECAEWFYSIGRIKYPDHASTGMEDDWFFKAFMEECHPDMEILKLEPSLVDHVDYLIGGSILQGWQLPHRAKFFDDKDLVRELELQLKRRQDI